MSLWAVQLQIQLVQILKPGNVAGPGIFSGAYAAGDDNF